MPCIDEASECRPSNAAALFAVCFSLIPCHTRSRVNPAGDRGTRPPKKMSDAGDGNASYPPPPNVAEISLHGD